MKYRYLKIPRRFFVVKWMTIILILLTLTSVAGAQQSVRLENENFKLSVDVKTGALSSFLVKRNNCDLIAEKKLESNFRICLPLKDYACNYIDGMEQKPESVTKNNNAITVLFSGMQSSKGKYSIDLSYTVALKEDYVSFTSKLTNNDTNPISEFWFPRIGGLKDFGDNRDAKLALPNNGSDSRHTVNLFQELPGSERVGSRGCGMVN